MSTRKIIVMAIKPKYAKAIYEGRKRWEFRKKPPRLWEPIYIYESAPVSKITGVIVFSLAIHGYPDNVYNAAKKINGRIGTTFKDVVMYSDGGKVSALLVEAAQMTALPIELNGKVPQNWGTYVLTTEENDNGNS
jgi:predicted transcriptional regulator